ncbi:sulfotransferase family protein [Halomonas sp. MCCC 1A11036]|uniref:Sulfotransferase family protein n=1 Tax=Billgrantia zhangzhouensis TaxID=2733481 RepID=A0ABS9AAL3_9GAMM|nr:sulfotransferase family protein [Halomonas zhangzhouensis]MCE8018923.1 sulfotransferase family protein [Halomonas zhangzhouensis]
MRELDIGTHISLKYDYIYFQVSKSASSTVKYYLQELEVRGTRRRVEDVNNRNLSPHIWPSQLKEEHFLELLASPDMRKVTFVRNPFSRLLSCYLHRIKESPGSPSVKNIKRFTRNRFDETLSFGDFVEIVCDQPSAEQDSHWRVQSDEVLYDLIPHWSFIGRVERIEEDLPKLMAILDPDVAAPTSELEDYSPSVTKASSKLADFYTPEFERKVVERYRADFENFGYAVSIELAG